METPHKIKRYPSIRSFEKNEAGLFFGRDLETQQLFNKVLAEREVLLFARSGIGKSSLINAGLIPLLEKRGFLPLPVRLSREAGAGALQPDALVKKALEPYFDQSEIPAGYPYGLQLWEYVKCCSFPLGATPVLILDQFEQFFYFTAEEQRQFILQLAELAQQYEPARVANWYSDLDTESAKRDNTRFAEQPPFKVVIAIRSDRLYEMNRLAEYMPTILRNRYELQPLLPESAEKAITAPAARQDENLYQSRDFVYSAELKNAIITNLQGGNGNIETTQLQIVCSEIENRILLTPEGEPARPAGYEVSLADIQAIGGIEKIIDEFYGNQVAKMGDAAQVAAAKDFIENELYDAVNNGRRIVFEEEAKKVIATCAEVQAANNITPDQMLTRLLDLRLIREDLRENRKFYEISHDYLLGAIGKAYESARMETEKKAAEERNRELLLEIKRRRKKQAVTYLLLGISLAAMIASVALYQITRKQREEYKDAVGELYTAKAKERMDNYDNYQAYNLLYAANEINHTSGHDTLIGLIATELLAGRRLDYLGNDIFANLTYDSILYVWNCSTRPFTLLKSINKPGEYSFSKDGSKLIMLDSNRQVTVWKWGNNKAELHGSFDVNYIGERTQKDSVFFSDDGNTVVYLGRNGVVSGYAFKDGSYTRLHELTGINAFEKAIPKKQGEKAKRFLNSTGEYLVYYLPDYSKKKNRDDDEIISFNIYLAALKDKTGNPGLIAKSVSGLPVYNSSADRLLWRMQDGIFKVYDVKNKITATSAAFKNYCTRYGKEINAYNQNDFQGNFVISFSYTLSKDELFVTDWINDTVIKAYANTSFSDVFYWKGKNCFYGKDSVSGRVLDVYTGSVLFSVPSHMQRGTFEMLDSATYVFANGDSIVKKNTLSGEAQLINYTKHNFAAQDYGGIPREFLPVALKVHSRYFITASLLDKTILFFPHLLTPDSLRNIYPPLRPEEKKQFRID